MANSLKSANRVELRCLWAPCPRFGLNLSPLDNYDIIGTVALFGRHGVTWGDLAVTAKSPQVVCHLPDEHASNAKKATLYHLWKLDSPCPSRSIGTTLLAEQDSCHHQRRASQIKGE